jgi:hypothetical protein
MQAKQKDNRRTGAVAVFLFCSQSAPTWQVDGLLLLERGTSKSPIGIACPLSISLMFISLIIKKKKYGFSAWFL